MNLNCPRCNAPVQEGASFCASCGASLAPLPNEAAPPGGIRSRTKVIVAAVALFIVAFIVVAAVGGMLQGGGDDRGANDPAGGDDTGLPDASTTPAADQIADITLSGSGDTVTERFELSSGVAIFRMTYEGDRNFIVTLYTSAGETVDLVANKIGSYSGSSLVGVTGGPLKASEGEHYLEVKASGPWEIVVEHSKVTSVPSTPLTLTGSGDEVEAFQFPDGPVQFTMNHEGDGYFGATLYDANGRTIDLLANEVGAYSGSTSVSSTGGPFGTSAGIHYIDVSADGDWSIQIAEI